MADFEEDSVFTEGVRAFEATDPARFDVLNDTIKPLVDRTRYLYDNMGQSGGAAVEWIEADGQNLVDVSDLAAGSMYILDVRQEGYTEIRVYPDTQLTVPIGTEYHFVCAGDPQDVAILPWNTEAAESRIISAAGLVGPWGGSVFNKNGSIVTLKKISETDWLLFGDIAEGGSEGFPSLD